MTMIAKPTDADFKRIKSIFNTVMDLPLEQREAALQAMHDDPAVGKNIVWWVRSIMIESDTDSGHTAAAVEAVSSALASGADMAAELNAGDMVGAWKLIEEIGRGGMGSVFLVERSDGHFEQRAALKLLAGFASERAMAHLARERQILAALNHPNIARLLDGGATPRGRPYLVLEHVNGQAIDQYCANKNLSEMARLNLFIQVCMTVAFAHRQLVVHCDLKPSNILVTNEGRPILLDFGVSRLMHEVDETAEPATPEVLEISNASATLTSATLTSATPTSATLTSAAYTPRYASPEQKAGERVGMATDVYSLGLMLAELLGIKITANQPLTAAQLSPLNADLSAIVARAVAPVPADRYAGADALADDLQRFLTRQPVAARAATPQYIAAKFTRRNWPWLAAAAAFLVTISVFSWRTVLERDNARAAEATARKAEVASREVKDYMISVFQGADPEVSGQRDLPVSALLDAGRERMATRLKDQPETRAEMGGILGSVYQNIGQREQALKLFDEAIAIERKNNRAEILAELIYKKANTIYDMDDYPRAEPFAREALALYERLAPQSMQVADTLRLLGVIRAYQGHRKEATQCLDQAIAISIKRHGKNSVEAGRAYLALGLSLTYIDGAGIDSHKFASIALRIFGQQLGKNHYLYANALEIVAVALGAQGKFDEAIPIVREMSEMRTKLYGEFSNQNGFGLYSYANLLDKAGHRMLGIPLLERGVMIQEKLDGRATVSTAISLYSLAELQLRTGAYAAAALSIDEVLALRIKLQPATSIEIIEAQYLAGRVHRLAGNLVRAEPLILRALQAKVDDPKTQARHLAHSKLDLAALYRQQGKFDAALSVLTALDTAAATNKQERNSAVVMELGRVAAARGFVDLAVKHYLDAESFAFKSYGETHPDAWLIKLDRAELLAKLGQRAPARELAKQIAINAKPSIAPTGDFAKRLAKLGA